MNSIKFDKRIVDDVYEFHFYSGFFYPDRDDRIITKSESFYNNKILWEDWCSSEGIAQSYLKFGISNHLSCENILLYTLFIWDLMKMESLLGVGIWETDTVEEVIGKVPIYINWEHHLTHQEEIDGVKLSDDGFIRAKSSVRLVGSQRVNRCPVDKTGLFKIENFQELVGLNRITNDASFSFNYYIGSDETSLIKLLVGEINPEKKLLDFCDIFVSLIAGQDLGYCDYLVVKSKRDISKDISMSANKVNGFASTYIDKIKHVKNSKEMIALIDQLVAEIF